MMVNKVLKRGAIATTTIEDSKLEPILRWAGGKRQHKWLFEAIANVFNSNRHRLIEPFCGGLAIALGVDPKWALLNDANPYLINLYRQIKSNFCGLGIDPDLKNYTSKESYYKLRDRFNVLCKLDTSFFRRAELAELFYYLNRTGFNGLCRFNQSGGYNVPYGKLSNPNLDHDFGAYRDRFKNWVFTCMDFGDIQVFPHDIVVADPPYDVAKGKQDHDYVAGGFGWDDQVRLANWLASHNVPIFACNLATDRIVDLYSGLGFDIQFVEAPRAIACNGERAKVSEILATKNLEAIAS